MDRYLISELLPPFLFGVGAFASLVLAIDSLFELMRKLVETGLPITIAFKVIALKLPNFVVLSFPMSTLLATLMTYSRLSSESELIALRGCGVSVYRMVMTAVMLSFLITGITFIFNEQIVPAANYEATATLERALKSDKPTFKRENIVYPEYRDIQQPDGTKEKILTRLFYADKFNGKQMTGLTIIDRSQSGLSQIVVSESGEWNASQNVWDFYNGTIYLVAPDRSYRNILRFQHQQLRLPRTPLNVAQNSRDYEEMNIAQAMEQLELERLSGNAQKIRKLKVRIQQKIALPFACVVCGLVGATVGTVPQRTGRGASFGISLLVIFTYYVLLRVTRELGDAGMLPSYLAAWLPNIIGLTIGLFLLVRVARR
ncbi:LptF/LptG family permease [Calothrix sp. 336/3]|uniref:LptF/LptG family permease n=1 Tax=Calothrix sp. 336/3 TaxID=1337936 RepID=UPI0004E4463B|nr:LptF/LptG family permease [Calothrix sp. 336/3]AKG24608.1 permease [Calothrix sp. 336/3]